MRPRRPSGFTLVELLIAISIISVLVAMLMPAFTLARGTARTIVCLGNLRQLGAAWDLYADDHRGYCMPQLWPRAQPPIYWWGTNGNPPDYAQGLIAPYIDREAGLNGVFDCPEQPWGSYIPQGAGRKPTTTYGYNALYLCPPYSGWGVTQAEVSWRTMDQIDVPGQVFIFADTLLDWTNRGHVSNNCMLDGPQVPWGTFWSRNYHPTLCFRHRGRACVFFADAHVDTLHKVNAYILSKPAGIGYVGQDNAPHYVPDWREWF